MTSTMITAPAVSAVRIIAAHDVATVDTGLTAARRVADSGATVRDMIEEGQRVGLKGATKRPGAWLVLSDIEPLPWARTKARPVYQWDALVSAAGAIYQSKAALAEWGDALEDATTRDEALEALLEVATDARAADAARKRSGSGTPAPVKPAPVKPAPESRSVSAILADVLGDLARLERRTGEIRPEDHVTLVAIGAALEAIAVNA